MRYFVAIIVAVLFSGCNKKKVSYEELLKNSGEQTKKAFSRIQQKSSSFEELSKLGKIELDKIAINSFNNKNTYLKNVTKDENSVERLKKNIKIAQEFFNSNSKKPKNSNYCYGAQSGYFDPPKELHSEFLKTDFYTRKTVAIDQIAAELGTINEIVNFIRYEIKTEILIGATQSADVLLKTKRGTNIDKMNLLVAILKAKGIPTQLVAGDVFLAPETAKKYFGVGNYSELVGVIDTSFKYVWEHLISDGNLKYVKIPHIWARSFIDGEWKNLDIASLNNEYQKIKKIGIVPDFNPDLTSWMFEPNEKGEFIRPISFFDSLFSKVLPKNEIDFLTPSSELFSIPNVDGILSDENPCIKKVVQNVEGSLFEFQGEINLYSMDKTLLGRVKLPLAKISEQKSYFGHSAGLISDPGVGSGIGGLVQFKVGEETHISVSATTGTNFIVNYNFIYPSFESDTPNIIQKSFQDSYYMAGGISVVGFFARRVSEEEIIEAIAVLRNAIDHSHSSKVIMTESLRLAEIVSMYRLGKSDDEIELLYNLRQQPIGVFSTQTSFGKILYSGLSNRELGIMPTQPIIDIEITGYTLMHSTNDDPNYDYGFSEYDEEEVKRIFYAARLNGLVNGSELEANIWEQLFGLKGYCAIRVSQLAAKINADNGTNTYHFIKGTEFDGQGGSAILTQIPGPSILTSLWPMIVERFDEAGTKFWGPTTAVIDTDSCTGGSCTEVFGYVIDGGPVNDGVAHFGIVNYSSAILADLANSMENKNAISLYKLKKFFGADSNENVITPEGGGADQKKEKEVELKEGENIGIGPSWRFLYHLLDDPSQTKCTASSNPVEYSTGLMWHQFVDFNLRGKTDSSRLVFERTYFTLKQYNWVNGWNDLGDFGRGWVHNYDTRLLDGSKDSSGTLNMGELNSGTTDILLIGPQGNPAIFTHSSGSYTSPAGFIGNLSVVGNTYVLTLKENLKYIFKKDLTSNFNGRLVKIIDSHAEEINVFYDSNGRLQKISSGFAGDLIFVRGFGNKVVNIINSKNNLKTTYTYIDNRLKTSQDFDGRITKYDYNISQVGTLAEGLLSKFTDPLGRSVKFEYYQNGKVYKEIGFGNAVQAYQYAPYQSQKYTLVVGPNGKATEFRYDDKFRLTLKVNPDGSREFYNWNSDDSLSSERDSLGYWTYYKYDLRRNTEGVKKPEYSNFPNVKFDQTFDVPISISPLVGSKKEVEINPLNGDIISIGSKNKNDRVSISYTYDSFGKKLSTNNGINAYSNFTDENGFTKIEFDSRNPIENKYDGRGRIIEQKYSSGRVLSFNYDNRDLVTATFDTHGPDFRLYYDDGGRLLRRERIAGSQSQTESFSYDDRDRLTVSTNYNGERTLYKYDIVGSGCHIRDVPSQVTNAEGKTTKYLYDDMGRKIEEIAPDGSSTYYGYNFRGDLVIIVDSLGNNTQFLYDGNKRLIKKLSQSAGIQTSKSGISQIGYLPNVEYYSYDEADRLVKKEQVLNEEGVLSGSYVTEFKYDDLGRIIQKTISHKRGLFTVEQFDQVDFKYYPILEPAIISEIKNKYLKSNYTYELQPPFAMTGYAEEPTEEGKALKLQKRKYTIVPGQTGPVAVLVRDGLKVLEQSYDPAGRVLKTQGSFSGFTNTAVFSYDDIGRKTGVTYANGLNASYTYDFADRAKTINWTGSSNELSESIDYTAGGLIKKIQREIGTFNYKYTPKDEIADIKYSGSESLNNNYVNTALSYDSAGNIKNYRGINFNSLSNFTTQVDANNFYRPGTDGLGNAEYKLDGTNTQELNYFPNGQLRKFLVYNSSNSLTKSVEYYYDGLGRRIAKVIKQAGENPIYVTYAHLTDQNKNLFATIEQGATKKEVLYVDGQGIDDHLFEIGSVSGIKNYKKDHLGSVINSSAAGGKSVYGIYGENLGTPPSLTALEPVVYGFTGREFDVETGLYYFRARYYDPLSARFLSKDPLGPHEGGDLNSYRYAGNNPLILTDPLGLDAYLASRPIDATFGQASHQFIVIDNGSSRPEVISFGRTASGNLGNISYRDTVTLGGVTLANPNSTFRQDLQAYEAGRGAIVRINAPDDVVREVANGYSSTATYGFIGQNSNTAAQDVANLAQGGNISSPSTTRLGAPNLFGSGKFHGQCK